MTQRIFGNESGEFLLLDERGNATGRADVDSELADLFRFAGLADMPAPMPPQMMRWLRALRPNFFLDGAVAQSRLFALPSPAALDVSALLETIDGRAFEILVTSGSTEPVFAALDVVAPEGVVFTRHSALLFRSTLTDGSRRVYISTSVLGGVVDAIVDRETRPGWDVFTEMVAGARGLGEPTLIRSPPGPQKIPRLSRRRRTLWLERQLSTITGSDFGLIEQRHLMREPCAIPASSTMRFSEALARLYGVRGNREVIFVVDQDATAAGGHFERHVGVLLDEWQLREPLGVRLSVSSVMGLLGTRVRDGVSREDVLARESWGDEE